MIIIFEVGDEVTLDDDLNGSPNLAAGHVKLIKKLPEGKWLVQGTGEDEWSPKDVTDIVDEGYFNVNI